VCVPRWGLKQELRLPKLSRYAWWTLVASARSKPYALVLGAAAAVLSLGASIALQWVGTSPTPIMISEPSPPAQPAMARAAQEAALRPAPRANLAVAERPERNAKPETGATMPVVFSQRAPGFDLVAGTDLTMNSKEALPAAPRSPASPPAKAAAAAPEPETAAGERSAARGEDRQEASPAEGQVPLPRPTPDLKATASVGDLPVPLPRPAPRSQIAAAADAAPPVESPSPSGKDDSRPSGAQRNHGPIGTVEHSRPRGYGTTGPIYLVSVLFGGWRR
jgi:hypothetical protein